MRSASRSRATLLVAGTVIASMLAVAGWWAFRPELLVVDQRVSEALPAAASTGAAPRVLATGTFAGHAHDTSGTATVYEVEGRRVLRLSDFMTSNGPDVRVVLVATEDARDDAAVKQAGYVSLGTMKGNVGDQNYDVPADLDLSKYRAVTIWCERFAVNFGTAPLRRA